MLYLNVKLTLIYLKYRDKGLTSIYLDPVTSTAFIGGMTAAKYPVFISRTNVGTPIPKNVRDFCIRCACLADSRVYYLDSSNRIFAANLEGQSVDDVPVFDLNRNSPFYFSAENCEDASLAYDPVDKSTWVAWRRKRGSDSDAGLRALQIQSGCVARQVDLRGAWLRLAGWPNRSCVSGTTTTST
jgi:hypothetical protein